LRCRSKSDKVEFCPDEREDGLDQIREMKLMGEGWNRKPLKKGFGGRQVYLGSARER
jgi:hypothetical protein